MSAIIHAPVCYPPQFPEQGRLPSRAEHVQQNMRRQGQMERDHHNALSLAAGRRVVAPCCKTLHITLCFDGTGNNLNNDLYESSVPHPTNVARMFRASIGAGYVGGTSHTDKAQGLTDSEGTGNGQYYKYYMPGVGTPFPEVGDLDYGTYGLAFAGYGEERINWGLMMIIDALRRALKLPRQDNATLFTAVQTMGTSHGIGALTGQANRRRQFYTQFWPLLKPLRIALAQQPGQCQLLGLKLYVYGFSRGAAAARAFVSWLNELLSPTETTPSLKMDDVVLPISVEYLGLLDTVASVGAADIVPGADGHMGWADGNQSLPANDLLKRCLHLFASHEQRLCFPLESIRREGGSYPVNCSEVMYPGVHSDLGGGYPPGDQGKANGKDDRLLLSQIALNDLYADAFVYGAPLKVPHDVIPVQWLHETWRAMKPEVVRDFMVNTALVTRFNAWRQVTLGLQPASQPLPVERAERYEPVQATDTLEHALRGQMAWITAWRIDRYAFASLLQTPFYLQSTDSHADPVTRKSAATERDRQQAEIVKQRRLQQALERIDRTPAKPLKSGFRDFDPDMAQTQLREAAEEFGAQYRDPEAVATVLLMARLHPATRSMAQEAVAQARVERKQMKAAGLSKLRELFPQPKNEYEYVDENKRGNIDESRNATQPEGLLRALFDDQVHDSRAWFLYATLLGLMGTGGREPFGHYLRERTVFFGETSSRVLARVDENGELIVAADTRLQGIAQPGVSQPPMMDAECLAKAQRAIDARWQAFHAQTREVNDASAV